VKPCFLAWHSPKSARTFNWIIHHLVSTRLGSCHVKRNRSNTTFSNFRVDNLFYTAKLYVYLLLQPYPELLADGDENLIPLQEDVSRTFPLSCAPSPL
jgi:hypothetical protein